MKKLVFCALALAAMAQASTGCIIVSDDDDGGSAGILVQASWICPADATGISIAGLPAGSDTTLTPDDFDCADGGADILFDAGDWEILATPFNDIGDEFVTFTSDPFSGVDGDAFPIDFDFPDADGFFQVEWSINGQDPLTECDVVAADGAAIDATLTGPDQLYSTEFACVDGIGVSDPFPLGDYMIDVSVTDGGTAISDPDPFGASLDFGSQLNDLGLVDLNVPI